MLRIVHILLGVIWAGTLIFVALFLEPSVREAGPDGAKVMQGIMRRKYLTFMPWIAGLTILSGVTMYWRMSAGFNGAWVTSPIGLSLGLGGLTSLVAYLLAMLEMRRPALKAAALGAALQQNPDAPNRDATMAEIQALRQRTSRAGRWVAALLAVAVVTMAVGRYL